MVATVLAIIHVIVCLFLILVVLLQTGKGADIAAAFGGTSQTAFGARGATSFLSKLTTGAAVVFMLTSLTLALVSGSPSQSVVQETAPATQGTPMPAQQPAATPADANAAVQPPADQGGSKDQSTPAATPAPESPAPAAAPAPESPAPGASDKGGGSKDGGSGTP